MRKAYYENAHANRTCENKNLKINSMKKTPALFHFVDPVAVVKQLKIPKGSVVADFGCGAGYFSIPLAEEIGKEGIVYSLDVLPQALESVESRAKVAGTTNIITRRVNLEKNEGSKLDKNSIDWVIIKDMLFQNSGKDAILKEAHRLLKPQGKAFIMEWNDKNFSVGPEKKLRVPLGELQKLVRKHKFSIEEEINAGDFHYALVVKK